MTAVILLLVGLAAAAVVFVLFRIRKPKQYDAFLRQNSLALQRLRKILGNSAQLEIDHIIPIAKGGKTTYRNLQTLCHRCNVQKEDRLF